MWHQKATSSFCQELLFDPQYEFGDQTVKAQRLKLADGFCHLLLEWSFPRNKLELNESQQLKFYQVKQLKENSTENSAEKNFKEDSQFNELRNISTKQKEKKNTQIQRTLFRRHSLG